MAYKWTDTEEIQAYLDGYESTVIVGAEVTDEGNFPVATAEKLENDAVDAIETILSLAWETPLPTDFPLLQRMAARYTAGTIVRMRTGSALGDTPEWAREYRDEVLAQATRMLLNHNTVEIAGATKRQFVDTARIFLLAKTRERTTPQLR